MANTITAGNATNGGTAISSDTSGILELKTGSTPTTALTISTGQVLTVVNPIQGGTITSGTAVASTSGTSIDFTSIPSWVKRITMVFNGVSVSGTQVMQIQLGTGGSPTTSGYAASAGVFVTSNVTIANSLTTGFAFNTTGGGGGTQTYSGLATFVLISGNIWICSAQVTDTTNVRMGFGGGTVSLAGTLNMVRLTTIGGTDTFDAGSVNILYE